MTGIEIKAIIAALIIGLGVAIPMPDFLGGVFIGVGCAYAVMIFKAPENRQSLWATLFVAVLCIIMAAIAYEHLPWISELKPQVVLGAAGGLSSYLVLATMSFGEGLVKWARELPEKFKLPGGK